MALNSLSLQSDAYMDYTLHEENKQAISSQDLTQIRIRHINSLTLSNFKSFAGEHYVGPFTAFTGVMGPNGGGKSNILDAIAFTLGLTIRDLRCSQPEDLIYSRFQYNNATIKKEITKTQAAVMWVEIVFTANTTDMLRVRRSMSDNGDTAIQVNGAQVSDEEFAIFMLNSKLHVSARNFLLFQGEAESLSVQSPSQMTELFERLSGSVQYKREYTQFERKLGTLVHELRDLQLQRAHLKTESRKLKELKQTSHQYKQLNNEIEELRVRLKLYQLHNLDQDLQLVNERVVQLSEDQDQKHSIITEIQKCDVVLKQYHKSIHDNQRELKGKQTEMALYETQVRQSLQDQKFVSQQISQIQMSISKIKQEIKREQEMIQEIGMDLQGKQRELQQAELQERLVVPQQWVGEYAELQERFQQDHFQLQSYVNKIEQQQRMLQQLIQQTDQSYHQAYGQYSLIESNIELEKTEVDQINQKMSQLSSKLQSVNESIKQIEGEYRREQLLLQRLRSTRIEQELQIQHIENSMADHIEEEESRRIVQQLLVYPKFLGELSGLLNPVSQQWSNALKIGLGQRMLCALVVHDTQTAFSMNKFLKSVQAVKNVIILEKVKEHDTQQDSELRATLEAFVESYRRGGGRGKHSRNGRGVLAIDVVECEKNVDKLLGYLLRGTVLTDSYQLAVEVQQARIPGVYQVVTQEGVQMQQGMIVAHQRLETMRSFRSNNTKVKPKSLSMDILQANLEETLTQIRSLRASPVEERVKELSSQKLQMEEQNTQMHVQLSIREKQVKSIVQQMQPIEEKVQKLQLELKSKQEQLSSVEKILQGKKQELQSLQGEYYAQFSRKTGIPQEQLLAIIDGEQVVKRKDAIENIINKLENQKADIQQRVRSLSKKMDELVNELQTKENAQNSQSDTSEDANKQLSLLKDQIEVMMDKQNQLDHKLKQQNRTLKDLMEKRDSVMKHNIDLVQNRTLLKSKMDQLQQEKQKIIEECEMESIEIKMSTNNTIDYSLIERELDQDTPQILIAQINRQIEVKENNIAKYLSENLQMGLIGGKTDEKFQQLEIQIKVLTEKLNGLYEEETIISDALRSVNDLRTQRFNELFKRVSEEINSLYRSLTFQEATQLGGSALLYLENQQQPFAGGVIYTTTPPNKKYVFDSSEQLSGGEKTIASVALLLALNSALGSPFMLLDEIDANLDPDNAMRLRLVIQALSGKPTQFIIISHNVEVFARAQSLIGVTIQAKKKTSEAFSMLL